jgi:hypothetical protein
LGKRPRSDLLFDDLAMEVQMALGAAPSATPVCKRMPMPLLAVERMTQSPAPRPTAIFGEREKDNVHNRHLDYSFFFERLPPPLTTSWCVKVPATFPSDLAAIPSDSAS